MFAGSIPGSLVSVRKQSPGHARVIKPASGRQWGWSRWCHRGGMSVGLHRQCSVPPARTRTRAHTRIRAHTHTRMCTHTDRQAHTQARTCMHARDSRACMHAHSSCASTYTCTPAHTQTHTRVHTGALTHLARRHAHTHTQVRSRTSHAHAHAGALRRGCARTGCTHVRTHAGAGLAGPLHTPRRAGSAGCAEQRGGSSPRGPGCGAASPGRSHPTVTPAPLPSRTLPGGLRAGTGRTRVLAVPPVGPRLRREVGQSRLLPTQPGLEPGSLRGTTHPPKIPPPFSRHTPRGRTWPRRPLGVVVQPVVDCAGSGSDQDYNSQQALRATPRRRPALAGQPAAAILICRSSAAAPGGGGVGEGTSGGAWGRCWPP